MIVFLLSILSLFYSVLPQTTQCPGRETYKNYFYTESQFNPVMGICLRQLKGCVRPLPDNTIQYTPFGQHFDSNKMLGFHMLCYMQGEQFGTRIDGCTINGQLVPIGGRAVFRHCLYECRQYKIVPLNGTTISQ